MAILYNILSFGLESMASLYIILSIGLVSMAILLDSIHYLGLVYG